MHEAFSRHREKKGRVGLSVLLIRTEDQFTTTRDGNIFSSFGGIRTFEIRVLYPISHSHDHNVIDAFYITYKMHKRGFPLMKPLTKR